jgi:hypothetical protein
MVAIGDAEHPEHRQSDGPIAVDELARRKRVRPITSAEDLACDGIFDSDEELDEFLAHVSAMRHSDIA